MTSMHTIKPLAYNDPQTLLTTPFMTFIYRCPGLGDGTGGGVTSAADTAYLINYGDPDPRLPEGYANICVLVLMRSRYGNLIAVPTADKWPMQASGPMFGGNFVYSHDSRFPGMNPIPVYDRFEPHQQPLPGRRHNRRTT